MSHSSEAIRQQAALWAVKMAERSLTEDEEREMTAWFEGDPQHADALIKAQQQWIMLGTLSRSTSADALLKADASTVVPLTTKVINRRRWSHWATAAVIILASLPALFLLPDAWLRWQADYYTATGEIRQVTLPDGSRVDLDSHSAIALDFNNEERRVRLLSGNAWFTVAPLGKDEIRPFRVEAEGGMTQALGTQFSIDLNGGGADVAVHEHSVRVSYQGQSLVLTEQQGARYADNHLVRHSVSPSQFAWRRGWLIIDKQPVSDAVAQINRYQNQKVIVVNPTLRKRIVSGTFTLNTSENAIETLRQTLGAELVTLPGMTLMY
ncbi:FecR domain-containing protein [Klebsiella sp. BIGb0407]|uniref:FecR family protein n=1 Tax=Klebsiella sp. BIGb0407 TaxID=2940603 RepID=UPI0021677880|nr:FecR domain-containing protein [Klebsiella sp. BIGb0407]MCS3433134.1 transmembrane sensor [Klebsiella sp. BIGb0407]